MKDETANIIITEATKIDGAEANAGAIYRDMPVELALQLVGAGKARKATDEELAAPVKAAK
ncbi:MAG: hypothetical protein AB3X44_16280 [Leptothrix sp. (in: b-proteobacteria)]